MLVYHKSPLWRDQPVAHGEVVVARISAGDDANSRPNLRLSGIEDAARLSLGDFDEPDAPRATPLGLLRSIPAGWAVPIAYLALVLIWFSA